MSDRALHDRKVLVVEDEYIVADELVRMLTGAGASVLGPVGTLRGAMDLIRDHPEIDYAILDANLRGEMIFPAAELLRARGVPFLFTTGYAASAFPPRFQDVIRCEKPVDLRRITEALGRTIAT